MKLWMNLPGGSYTPFIVEGQVSRSYLYFGFVVGRGCRVESDEHPNLSLPVGEKPHLFSLAMFSKVNTVSSAFKRSSCSLSLFFRPTKGRIDAG